MPKFVKYLTDRVVDKSIDPNNEQIVEIKTIIDSITIAGENTPTIKELYEMFKRILVNNLGYVIE